MSWRAWTFSQWNEAILEHFLRRRSDDTADTVSRFLVVPESLALATADPDADPSEALICFEEAVRQSMRDPLNRDNRLDLIATMQMVEKKTRWTVTSSGTPPFLSHLFLTCVAASVSDAEHRDEGSFHRRLEEMLQLTVRYRQGAFTELPGFWERLACWTGNHQEELSIKRLLLPQVHQTARNHLIGFSEKLSFPDRRDMPQLAGVLVEMGSHRGTPPPVAAVINAVKDARRLFSPVFLEAFEDFLNAFHSRAPGLLGHKFWSAVMEAHQRARTPDDMANPEGAEQSVELFGEEDDPGLRLFFGTRENTVPIGCTTLSPGIPTTDGWIHPLFVMGQSPYDLPLHVLADPTHVLLRIAPVLGRLIVQGLVPLGPGPDGYLVITTKDIQATTHAMVHTDLAAAIQIRFGGTVSDIGQAGWNVVTGLALDFLPRDLNPTDPLARCWCLQESLNKEEGVSVSGGIRCGTDWIWMPEMLPHIRLRGAERAVLVSPRGEPEVVLTAEGQDDWTIPPQRKIRGSWTFRGTMRDDSRKERRITFIEGPTQERPKTVNDPSAWLVESLDGVVPLDEYRRFESSGGDPSEWMQDSIFLGKNLGEFVHERASAAWEATITSDGKRRLRALAFPAGHSPDRMATKKGMRRKWKQLFKWADTDDAPTRSAREEVQVYITGKMKPATTEDFKFVALGWTQHRLENRPPAPSLEKLVAFTVAAGSARAGLRPFDWLEACRKLVPELRPGQEWDVLNAWQTAGHLDHLQFFRWDKCAIFPRPRKFLLVEAATETVAYLQGLVLPTTVQSLKDEAALRGVCIREEASPWPFLPPKLCICGEEDKILGTVKAVGIPVERMRVDWFGSTPETVESRKAGPPFRGYKLRTRISVPPHGLALSILETDNGPRIWMTEIDGATHWSHSRNIALIRGLVAQGRTAFRPEGRREIVSDGCMLPLPIGRTASLLGEYAPYPTENGVWRYSFPSEAMRDRAMATADTTFRQLCLTR